MIRLLSSISLLIFGTCILAGQLEPRIEASKQQGQKAKGALDIRIHPSGTKLAPPAELLLANPRGARTGSDPRTKKTLSEISNSSYVSEGIADAVTGSPGPETRILYVGSPLVGDFILWVIGTATGAYDLEIRGYDRELDPSDVKFLEVKIAENEVHKYRIQFTGTVGHSIAAFLEP